ncbi:MAG TPA: sigma 54-interacting transcriptional regulator [Rectinemataceae bacterium]|nr:sigma 54-interacting transcriptional regulator [Rectinemataceae bacterium]
METLLFLADDPEEARALVAELAGHYTVIPCPDEVAAIEAARLRKPAALVVDSKALGRRGDGRVGTARLGRIRRVAGEAPIIALLQPGEDRGAAQLREAKALIQRPCGLGHIREAVDAAVGVARANPASPFHGSSAAILATAERLRLYAGSDYPVLILGESGTGKEIAARAIHELSPRSHAPFVDRNCSALPEQLAESELFGTERGAFTDAVARPGAFELARGGVLFLDEIGDAGPSLQAKLLRVLESGQCWRLGARSPIQVDARIVSATAADLRAAAAAGSFRSDLLYRIETLVLELPPLRSRREDIPELASRIALEASRGRVSIAASALARLAAHDWPGNVRELRNVVHRALVLAGDSPLITERELQF